MVFPRLAHTGAIFTHPFYPLDEEISLVSKLGYFYQDLEKVVPRNWFRFPS